MNVNLSWNAFILPMLPFAKNKLKNCFLHYILESNLFKEVLTRATLFTLNCDKVCPWLAAGLWFSPGTPVTSTNKTDHYDIAETLLKVALNTITITPSSLDISRDIILYENNVDHGKISDKYMASIDYKHIPRGYKTLTVITQS